MCSCISFINLVFVIGRKAPLLDWTSQGPASAVGETWMAKKRSETDWKNGQTVEWGGARDYEV